MILLCSPLSTHNHNVLRSKFATRNDRAPRSRVAVRAGRNVRIDTVATGKSASEGKPRVPEKSAPDVNKLARRSASAAVG